MENHKIKQVLQSTKPDYSKKVDKTRTDLGKIFTGKARSHKESKMILEDDDGWLSVEQGDYDKVRYLLADLFEKNPEKLINMLAYNAFEYPELLHDIRSIAKDSSGRDGLKSREAIIQEKPPILRRPRRSRATSEAEHSESMDSYQNQKEVRDAEIEARRKKFDYKALTKEKTIKEDEYDFEEN
jgi:hypothetical protein